MISVPRFFGFGALTPDAQDRAEDRSSPLWLITFTDLVGILVAFFVLLFSLSAVKAESWNAMTGRLASAPEDHSAPGNTGTRLIEPKDRGISSDAAPLVAFDLTYVKALIERQTAVRDDLGDIVRPGLDVSVADGRLRAFVALDDLITPDDKALSAEGVRLLTALAPIFTHSGNRVDFLVSRDATDAAGWNGSLGYGRLVQNGLAQAGYSGPVGLYARTGLDRAGVELIIHTQEREARNG